MLCWCILFVPNLNYVRFCNYNSVGSCKHLMSWNVFSNPQLMCVIVATRLFRSLNKIAITITKVCLQKLYFYFYDFAGRWGFFAEGIEYGS